MCLYPKLIKNKKYLPNKKNGYDPPVCTDERLRYVTAACGHCFECRKQKGNAWQIRMSEEMKNNPNAIFVTLTIDDENYKKLKVDVDSEDDNEIARRAIRLFLERIRKATKKSIRHWFVTEKGHEESKRVHLHGIIWHDDGSELVKTHWKYGFVFIGDYVNDKTICYITKYMTKDDHDNKGFVGKVFASAGIGKGYEDSININNNKFNGKDTNETYRLPNGSKMALPTYYRNKIYSEEQREELWKAKLDKGIVYVCGEEVNVEDHEAYMNLLMYHREKQARITGENCQVWEEAKYKKQLTKQREYYKKEKKRLEDSVTVSR